MRIKSGGGYNSTQTKSGRSGWKTEPKSNAGNPAGVNQMGVSTAFKKEPILREGKGYTPQKMGDAGVAKSYFNSATSGPGSGRTIYKSGTQSPTPPAKELPKGRDVLSEYGPERSKG
jgi:hypothetical protein